jgi:ATP-dependent Clp protease ATP-binding subunit ClpC
MNKLLRYIRRRIAATRKQPPRQIRSPFDKFTERARKALQLAQEEAQRLNHNYMGTEHILLGLAHQSTGLAAQVLTGLGVDLPELRSAVESIVGRGDHVVMGEIGLTPRAKRVIGLAADEARRLNHQYIGTEHLLLGLLREGEGVAAGVLQDLGVSLDHVRRATIEALGRRSGDR